MYDLRDMLCKELDEITRKGELGAGDLDIVHKLTDTIKNIDKIEMLEDDGYSQRRYSQAGDWEADMRGTYGKGSSYARRGTHYVRGHYSRCPGRYEAPVAGDAGQRRRRKHPQSHPALHGHDRGLKGVHPYG